MGEINISDILAITARTQSAAAPSSSFTAHHCQSTIRSDHENIKTFALSPIAWRCSWGHNSSHRKSVKSTTGSLGQECIARPGPEPADLTVRHSLLPLSPVSPLAVKCTGLTSQCNKCSLPRSPANPQPEPKLCSSNDFCLKTGKDWFNLSWARGFWCTGWNNSPESIYWYQRIGLCVF